MRFYLSALLLLSSLLVVNAAPSVGAAPIDAVSGDDTNVTVSSSTHSLRSFCQHIVSIAVTDIA
jgi:hypothetical protein